MSHRTFMRQWVIWYSNWDISFPVRSKTGNPGCSKIGKPKSREALLTSAWLDGPITCGTPPCRNMEEDEVTCKPVISNKLDNRIACRVVYSQTVVRYSQLETDPPLVKLFNRMCLRNQSQIWLPHPNVWPSAAPSAEYYFIKWMTHRLIPRQGDVNVALRFHPKFYLL